MGKATVIVSTYNQPRHLHRCLVSLEQQSSPDFEVIVADDGSTGETRRVIEQYARSSARQVRHVWQEDRGFRKTLILNKAVLASEAEYLVFIDGDCVAHPDFVREHKSKSERGHYLNGSLIRLDEGLSERITEEAIVRGDAFRTSWLLQQGHHIDRRYLRLSLSYGLRCHLNRATRTRLYWLGSNSSCFREDLMAVNGFDNRFSYGFEDGDFGNRLEILQVTPRTVRWTAVLLHLWHGKPWSDAETEATNRKLMDENMALARYRSTSGIEEIAQDGRCSRTPSTRTPSWRMSARHGACSTRPTGTSRSSAGSSTDTGNRIRTRYR